MTKKLIKLGDDLILVINKSLQKKFGITEKTELDMAVIGDTLVIKLKRPIVELKKPQEQIQEFVDIARKVVYEYDEVLDSNLSSKKMLEKMYQLIEKDKDFYDSYLTVHRILLEKGKDKEAAQILKEAYDRAIDRITDVHGNWPQKMSWFILDNRHLMRTIEHYAYFCWEAGKTDVALDIFRRLFRTNPNDNQGARHSILALRLGLGPQEWQEPFTMMRDGRILGLDAFKLTKWFGENSKKFPEEFQWFFDLHSQ